MTTALTNLTATGQIDANLTLLTDLLLSRRDTKISKREISEMVDAMSKPADIVWTLARVAALLNPYFDKDTPQGIREIEAEDWAEAIREYPQWAIERACRWWKSASNSDRRKRPLEGDIVARIRKEMEAVTVARKRIATSDTLAITSGRQEVIDPVISAERAAKIMADAGFKPKTFGGDA